MRLCGEGMTMREYKDSGVCMDRNVIGKFSGELDNRVQRGEV